LVNIMSAMMRISAVSATIGDNHRKAAECLFSLQASLWGHRGHLEGNIYATSSLVPSLASESGGIDI
ncbi:hypothetical protein HAX54_042855, partial [Datura stramonium]|nr:hypothetical protein [Datura stramonium]